MTHCDHCGTTGVSVILFGLFYRLVNPICCETTTLPTAQCKHLTTVATTVGSPVCQECGQSW